MLVYDKSQVTRQKNRLAQANEMVFLPLLHPKKEDIRRLVGDVYHCHPLVVENCLEMQNQPRLKVYADHAFFPFFFLKDDWTLVEISVVIGKNFVIAILEEPMPFLSELEVEFQESPEKMSTPGRILYEFLDLCVHRYSDFIDSIEERVDDMETLIYDAPESSIASDIFEMKRKLHRIRRVFSEERTVIEGLMHNAFQYTRLEDNAYLMDLFDHINRTVDAIDSFRDALSGLIDLQMSMKSDRMNSIMKTLTIVSTIFMPLAFIVGLYGTNLKVPEYHWRYGYAWMWFLILGSAFSLWLYFKKRKWF